MNPAVAAVRASPPHADQSARPTGAVPTALLCAAMALGGLAGLWHWTAGFEVWTHEGRRALQIEAGALQAAPVALRAADGRRLQPWPAAPGEPAATLVDFIYTRCPGVCRTLGSEFQQMQQQLVAQPAAVRLLSVSFDVAHDDVPALAAQAAALRAESRWWQLAVPTSEDAATRLLRSLGVVAVPDGQGGFVHNGAIHLLDGRGRLRGLYAVDQWPQALAAARALAAEPGAGRGAR